MHTEQLNTQLRDLVLQEAIALKEHATPEEMDNLDPETFNGGSQTRCVYGQLTGHCHNDRAIELIKLCCKKVYLSDMGLLPRPYSAVLNGSPNDLRRDGMVQYYSPIEVYVGDFDAKENIDQLLEFLKGNTDTPFLTLF